MPSSRYGICCSCQTRLGARVGAHRAAKTSIISNVLRAANTFIISNVLRAAVQLKERPIARDAAFLCLVILAFWPAWHLQC